MQFLFGAKGGHSFQHGVQIRPSGLAEEAQPHVKDRDPDSQPPVQVALGAQWQLFVEEDPTDVRAPVPKRGKTPEFHQRSRLLNRRFRAGKDPSELKGFGSRLAHIVPAATVERLDQAQVERVRDKPQILGADMMFSADADGVLNSPTGCLGLRCAHPAFSQCIDNPRARDHGLTAFSRLGQRPAGIGRYQAVSSTLVSTLRHSASDRPAVLRSLSSGSVSRSKTPTMQISHPCDEMYRRSAVLYSRIESIVLQRARSQFHRVS